LHLLTFHKKVWLKDWVCLSRTCFYWLQNAQNKNYTFYGLTLNDIPILAELGVFNRCQSIMDIKISLMDHPSLLRSAH
jgi:hypothetical protein